MNKKEITEKIRENAIRWSEEETLNNYAKRFFKTDDKIDIVLKKLNQLALTAENETIQLQAIKEIRELLTEAKNNQTNVQNNINLGDFLDNLKK